MADQALQVREEAPLAAAGPTLLQVIAAAAADPRVDIDKMRALIEMERAIRKDQAEVEFNAAMARLQPKLPRVVKSRAILAKDGKTARSKYAALEDIDAVTRPLLDEEGFSVSYTTEDSDKGTITIATVRHRLGHSIESRAWMPFDKSEYRTDCQCQGSTMMYGRRYAFCNAFNIITIGVDDDGQAAGWVSAEQLKNITDMVAACEMNPAALAAFLKFAEADTLKEIRARAYDRVMTALRAKEKQHREGVK